VPIFFRDRRAGSSKMDRAIVAEAVWRVPALRFGSRPKRVADIDHTRVG
jgi:hypothetical protein